MDLSDIFSGALSPAKWRALGEYLASGTVRGGTGVRVRTVGGKVILSAKRGRGSSTSAPADACPFGEVVTTPDSDPATKSISGGIIFCGDQTWNLDPQLLNLTAAGVWLVSIEVSCEVNRDDDGEILLPGVKTGTRPTGDWTKTAWTTGTDYPDNTPPDASTGNGTINIPLGKLTIADGAATFEKAGCGNITIEHCAGTLSHTRG